MAARETKAAWIPCVSSYARTGSLVASQTGAVSSGSSSAGKWHPTPRISGRPCSAKLRASDG
jgi:hypothetical protein